MKALVCNEAATRVIWAVGLAAAAAGVEFTSYVYLSGIGRALCNVCWCSCLCTKTTAWTGAMQR